jgi:hypothetical protein
MPVMQVQIRRVYALKCIPFPTEETSMGINAFMLNVARRLRGQKQGWRQILY